MAGDPSGRGAGRRERLEAEHRPEVWRLLERHGQGYLGNAVLGGIDGCVTTFAVVAGPSFRPASCARNERGRVYCEQIEEPP